MSHSMKEGLPVTSRMQQAFELVTEHGTRLAAAEVMGISSVAVGQFVAAYCRRTGAPPPYARSRPYALAARRVADADARATDAIAEARADALRWRTGMEASDARARHLEAELAAERAKVRDLEVRLASRPVAFTPTHRRRADGGRGGKRERRAAA